jgi:hypothetical protein
MQRWRLCGFQLREFGAWCLATLMGRLLRQRLCPWQQGCSKVGLMPQLLTGPLGSHSALIVVVSYFLELEVLRSGRSVDLTEDEVEALWSRVCTA